MNKPRHKNVPRECKIKRKYTSVSAAICNILINKKYSVCRSFSYRNLFLQVLNYLFPFLIIFGHKIINEYTFASWKFPW